MLSTLTVELQNIVATGEILLSYLFDVTRYPYRSDCLPRNAFEMAFIYVKAMSIDLSQHTVPCRSYHRHYIVFLKIFIITINNNNNR